MSDKRVDPSAMSMIYQARAYVRAASLLVPHLTKSTRVATVQDPVYFLCIHAVELAMKAFLISREMKILGTERETHLLARLYSDCESAGMQRLPQSMDWKNLCSLLDGGNKYNNFRYYNAKHGGGGIEVTLARERALDFVEHLRKEVEPRYANQPAGPATKLCLMVVKTVPK